MAIGAAVFVVLALVTVVITRPSGPDDGPVEITAVGPLPLADCQSMIAERNGLGDQVTCGYETTGSDRPDDDPPADPNDPQYAGAALPTDLSTNGQPCVTGENRPVLDTIRPKLTASYTPVAGLRRIESTFQLTGIDRYTPQDGVFDGGGDSISGRTTVADFSRTGTKLTHGETYRWRVRGTPRTVAARGWSPWCEFTVAEVTPDDLGIDPIQDFTVTLPRETWQAALRMLGPVERYVNGDWSTHAPIRNAVKRAPAGATTIAVTMRGADWSQIMINLCGAASAGHAPADWELVDQVSQALGGPEHLTMGYPRD